MSAHPSLSRNEFEALEKIIPGSSDDILDGASDSITPVLRSNERTFGHDIRRLVKLVCTALLNPSELVDID
jgi:hypothetical protein